MELVLRSRKILVGVREVENSFVTWDGQVRMTRKRVKLYDYVLDEAQAAAVERARELASRSGIALRVTDLSRAGALRRALWDLREEGGARRRTPAPSLNGARAGSRPG